MGNNLRMEWIVHIWLLELKHFIEWNFLEFWDNDFKVGLLWGLVFDVRVFDRIVVQRAAALHTAGTALF